MYKRQVVLLSETHLAPNRRFSLPAYACYRKDRNGSDRHRASGGVAILVHRRHSHRELPATETTLIEACAVALDVAGLEVRFVSAYHSPGHRAPPHEGWDALLDLSLIHI